MKTKKLLLSFCFIFFGLFSLVSGSWAAGPLRVLPSNHRYFTDDSGKAIHLSGEHTWENFQIFGTSNPPPESGFDYAGYLNMLKSNNLNLMRLWGWEQSMAPAGFPANDRIYPSYYVRTGPGNASDGLPKFDLSQLNQTYFDRMRQRIIDAGNRGIYVDIQLFNGWSVGVKSDANPWPYHPYNSVNNINGVNGDTNGDSNGYELNTLSNSAITAYQEAYVKKVIDTVNDLDNVLYEICNEAQSNSQDWQYHMINYIKNYEATKSKQHPVGMTVEYPGGNNAELFASPADWISPNDVGGYKDNPPLATGNKIITSDTDHLWGLGDRIWAWKSFSRGMNASYMDCYIAGNLGCPIAMNDPTRLSLLANLGYIRTYADKMDLASMTPQNSSTACSTTYCLTNPGREYLVYQPGSGAFSANLSAGTYNYEWFNPANGSVAQTGSITATAGSKSFTPPFSGDAVLYLKTASASDTIPPAAPSGLSVM